ncbi:conserved hypothetical protein [Luminiphilus syltensis NOR5-1B]|uniref:Lipoprotein n=2 Tax=Luminiphilus TaxID=1341118 RepID=B8KXS1_9GAMM|nr:conserved hypothetical protein [Luminiphilus syltensis NOR5-1B]
MGVAEMSSAGTALPSISIPFLTNRGVLQQSDGGLDYGTRIDALSGGRCQVDWDDNAPSSATNGPVESLSVERVLDLIDHPDARNVIVYVHGYNVSLERGCREAATLAHQTGFDGRVLLFSWPASDLMVTYWQDEAMFAASVASIFAALESVGSRIGFNRLNVVAHSMGSRLASAEMSSSSFGKRRLNHLVLVAPDIDSRIFREALPELQQRARKLSILVSDSDRLLLLSQIINLGGRLGRASDFDANGVDVFDVSDFDSLGLSQHLYHLESPQVGDVLRQVLDE